jgi:hypothetical protein
MKPLVSTAMIRRPLVGPARSRRGASRIGTLVELYSLLAGGGRWWLVPMVAVTGLTTILLIAVAAVEYVAPFVYTIF